MRVRERKCAACDSGVVPAYRVLCDMHEKAWKDAGRLPYDFDEWVKEQIRAAERQSNAARIAELEAEVAWLHTLLPTEEDRRKIRAMGVMHTRRVIPTWDRHAQSWDCWDDVGSHVISEGRDTPWDAVLAAVEEEP